MLFLFRLIFVYLSFFILIRFSIARYPTTFEEIEISYNNRTLLPNSNSTARQRDRYEVGGNIKQGNHLIQSFKDQGRGGGVNRRSIGTLVKDGGTKTTNTIDALYSQVVVLFATYFLKGFSFNLFLLSSIVLCILSYFVLFFSLLIYSILIYSI